MKPKMMKSIVIVTRRLFFDLSRNRHPIKSKILKDIIKNKFNLPTQFQTLRFTALEFSICDPSNHFKELHVFDEFIYISSIVFISNSHFGHAEAEYNLSCMHLQVTLLHEKVYRVLETHVFLGLCIIIVNLLQRFVVCLEYVVDAHGIQGVFPETLPLIMV